MTVYRNSDQYDQSNASIEGGLVKHYSKTEKAEDMVYIDYGASIFRERVLELIPKGEFYSLDRLFPRLAEEKELVAFEAKERFYEIGSPQGLEAFRQFAAGGLG